MIEIILLLLFALMVFGGGGYYYYTKVYKKAATTTPGDVITIGDDGVTKSSGSTTETYLDAPRMTYCVHPSGNPSWCDTDMSLTTEMNYVYDPEGGSLGAGGKFTTTFNQDTGLCSDGTKNCMYEEKFDSERKLIDITNAQGESLVNKFADDLWSGKIAFDDKENFKKIVTFENGALHIIMEDGTKAKMYPGISVGDNPDPTKLKFPVGIIILWTLFWYKANDKPKPTIKFNLKSEKTLGKAIMDFRAAKARATAPPT